MPSGPRWFLLAGSVAIYVAATCLNILMAFAENPSPVPHLTLEKAMAAVTSTPAATVTPTPTATATPTPVAMPTPTPEPTPIPTLATAPTATSPSPPPAEPQPTTTPVSTDLIVPINAVRASYGLPPLAPNTVLMAAASSYAQIMAEYNWFSHIGPDGSTFISRVEAAGYTGWIYLFEALFMGPAYLSPEQIVRAWLDDPPHRALVLSAQATEIGTGCYALGDSLWCVAEFGDR